MLNAQTMHWVVYGVFILSLGFATFTLVKSKVSEPVHAKLLNYTPVVSQKPTKQFESQWALDNSWRNECEVKLNMTLQSASGLKIPLANSSQVSFKKSTVLETTATLPPAVPAGFYSVMIRAQYSCNWLQEIFPKYLDFPPIPIKIIDADQEELYNNKLNRYTPKALSIDQHGK